MAKYAATIEKTNDGFTAAVVGQYSAVGFGPTREEAISDLQSHLRGLIAHLGQRPEGSLPEVATVEVEI